MPSHDKALAAAASAAASLMLVRSVANELLPDEVRDALRSGAGYLRSRVSSRHTITVERKLDTFTHNHVYEAVRTYLAGHANIGAQQHLCVGSMDEDEKMTVALADGEEMADVYDGADFRWCHVYRSVSTTGDSGGGGGGNGKQLEAHSFEQERALQIHMNEVLDVWSPMDLHHPSTFDTLAMDLKLKQFIVDELNRFVKRKDYYKRIGKAWKRGYLLYGPPGTGKSSLIVAMANHLRFDIYDLELTTVESNSYLRRLLVGISNRSILVVEDIDCTIKLQQREGGDEDANSDSSDQEKGRDKVTLSGLLNFVDGLWSAGGKERIIVFTTNYKERLDPALLRPGRMDMHIYLGYCTPESFRILAKNYHLIDYHAMYPEIEKLIKEAMVTPAEVAEVLMRSDDVDVALHDLVDVLKSKLNDASVIKTEHSSASNQQDEDQEDGDDD
ncbi:AAA-ATPase [Panicum miliaceum]|uniref:AAA-ATPase n=1 Tax=Panicum miliaceum TaxID=4540 RepID=A0A3L6SW82_PANMI|nr:AAA-ATPase [Panicum miliaceum]